MRNVAFTAVALTSLWVGCIEKETAPADLWRPLEPRLTTTERWRPCQQGLRRGGRAVKEECGQQSEPSLDKCRFIGNSRTTAERVLITQPQCIDDVIEAFVRFSRADPRLLADLAAAYYVRAQRDNSVEDLLSAVEAADLAVGAAPDLPAAHFNRALALQELALYGQAMESWDAFLKLEPQGGWADEARAHRGRIAPLRPEAMAEQWTRNRTQIHTALQKGDTEQVLQLIAPFPQTALQYFEDELLPVWMQTPTPETITHARIFAEALSRRFGGDRMPVETVQAIARAIESPDKMAALRSAHTIYRTERLAVRADPDALANAMSLFHSAGSPFAAVVQQRLYATRSAFEETDLSDDIAIALDHAERHHYLYLASRLHSTRGHHEWGTGTYIDSLAIYEDAARAIAKARDQQSEFANLSRMSGITALTGRHELALEQALRALRFPRMIDFQDRHLALGEASRAARSLERHRAALHYQDAAVDWIRQHTAVVPLERRPRLRYNLATALRDRADIKFRLGDVVSGERDLAESTLLFGDHLTEQPRLHARLKDVAARGAPPDAAVAIFTEALRLGKGDTRSFRASLLAGRAGAYRRLGKVAQARNDWYAALALVREEEELQLRARDAGEAEAVWSAYFSRFKEIYDQLVRQLVEDGDLRRAFSYVERARAYEPLDLIRRRADTPAEFRAILSRDSIDVADIQKHLPDGTFVLEYSVFDDRTFVWILSRDDFEILPLGTGGETIERWSEEIQRAVSRYDGPHIDKILVPVYAELLGPPLERIRTLRGGRGAQRLVIVADEAMKGIPLGAAIHPDNETRLLQYAPLSFSGSAALYVYSLLRSNALRVSQPQSILLIGDPASERAKSLGLPSLRYALLEITQIAEQYGRQATVLHATNATIANFLAHAPHYDIIHFAGHSMIDREHPFLSVLFFATTRESDGTLAAHELLTRLKLHRTTLFVLASCESADNMPVGPEGVAPLVRPLMAAGVPAVVGSLWNVSDATTQPLLVSFYDEYRRSGDAAASLQKAQLAMLNDETEWRRSVLAWGAFQLIGDTAPPRAVTTYEKEKPP